MAIAGGGNGVPSGALGFGAEPGIAAMGADVDEGEGIVAIGGVGIDLDHRRWARAEMSGAEVKMLGGHELLFP